MICVVKKMKKEKNKLLKTFKKKNIDIINNTIKINNIISILFINCNVNM